MCYDIENKEVEIVYMELCVACCLHPIEDEDLGLCGFCAKTVREEEGLEYE
jgi:hypothetical protein